MLRSDYGLSSVLISLNLPPPQYEPTAHLKECQDDGDDGGYGTNPMHGIKIVTGKTSGQVI